MLAQRRSTREVVVRFLPLVCFVVLYGIALRQVDLARIDGLGLISALPSTLWMAGTALVVGLALVLARRPVDVRMGHLYLLGLIVLLHATPGLVQAHPRFPTAWTHVGFVDEIVATGEVDTFFDARFSWPGGFSLGAFLVDLAGVDTARALLRFAPVVMVVLAVTAFQPVARAVTDDRARQLAASGLLVLGGWVGQDYLAPQALAFVWYLAMLGVLLSYFRRPRGDAALRYSLIDRVEARVPSLLARDRGTPPGAESSVPVATEVGVYASVVLLGLVAGFSHQLTPFMMFGGVVVLVLFGRMARPYLAVIMATWAVAWVAFGATDYLRSNLGTILGGIGDVSGTVDQNVDQRVGGSSGRSTVLAARAGLTALLGLLAAAGLAHLWRQRRVDWGVVALAGMPAALALMNGYGGEVVLRVLLFMVPFLALLASSAFVPSGASRRIVGVVAYAAALLVMLPTFMVARFGNESFEQIYSPDIAAWDALIEAAPVGSGVVVLNFAGPWRYTNLVDYHVRVYPDEVGRPPDVAGVDEMLAEIGPGTFLVVGVGTERYGVHFDGRPDGWTDELLAGLDERAQLDEVFRDGLAVVVRWDGPAAEQGAVAGEEGGP